MTKHHDQKASRERKGVSVLNFQIIIHWRKYRQKLKQVWKLEAQADAEAMEGSCLLACFPYLAQSSFLQNSGRCSPVDHWLKSHGSIFSIEEPASLMTLNLCQIDTQKQPVYHSLAHIHIHTYKHAHASMHAYASTHIYKHIRMRCDTSWSTVTCRILLRSHPVLGRVIPASVSLFM